jgi:hypothetical protein
MLVGLGCTEKFNASCFIVHRLMARCGKAIFYINWIYYSRIKYHLVISPQKGWGNQSVQVPSWPASGWRRDEQGYHLK